MHIKYTQHKRDFAHNMLGLGTGAYASVGISISGSNSRDNRYDSDFQEMQESLFNTELVRNVVFVTILSACFVHCPTE